MNKIRIVFIVFMVCFVNGCSAKKYIIEEQRKTNVIAESNSYMLNGVKLQTIEKSEYEKADVVYYAEDELALVKILQYNIEMGKANVAFQSENKMDMDKIASYLSYLNPYDISLVLSTTDYKDQKDSLIYQSNEIKIKNLDERYEEAELVAKRIFKEIIHPSMDNDQKIEAIHDYIAKTTIYDIKTATADNKENSVFKAAGALIDKHAVCSGYSRAFMMLARLADVPAIYITSDRINHGWNLVYGNDGWRYIDVTWDDPVPDQPNIAQHKFLNMSRQDFLDEGSHIFDVDKSNEDYLKIAQTFFNKNE